MNINPSYPIIYHPNGPVIIFPTREHYKYWEGAINRSYEWLMIDLAIRIMKDDSTIKVASIAGLLRLDKNTFQAVDKSLPPFILKEIFRREGI